MTSTERDRSSSKLEWVDLSREYVVIASAHDAVLHQLHAVTSDPFAEPMRSAGQPATTQWLLEGAIAAAGRALKAQRGVDGAPLTPERWAHRLAGYFHTTHATRRLLPLVLERFMRSGDPQLVAWTERAIADERGHDDLALLDLTALGYRARELVNTVVPARARAWVELFEQLARDPRPIGCIGYAHALERLALLRGATEIAAVESALPAEAHATRCLRVHSAVGSDAAHLRRNIEVTAALSAPERRAVVRACHATARIYFDRALDDAVSQGELQARLAPFRAPLVSRAERIHPNEEQARG